MHDIAILGQMRSGTTYAFSFLDDRLNRLNVSHINFPELFNPWSNWQISNDMPVFIDGANQDNLHKFDLATRIQMWDLAGHSLRLLKHLVMIDVDNQRLISHLMRVPCTWLVMERNHIDQCLSLLVAVQTWHWNVWSDLEAEHYRQSLEPFIADLSVVQRYIDEVNIFNKLKAILRANGQILHPIRYEHIEQDCDLAGSVICKAMGDDIIWPISSVPISNSHFPRKLLSLDEKRNLIKNIDDVMTILMHENLA